MANKGGGETLDNIGSFIGNALIPETMARFRTMNEMPKQRAAISSLIDSSGIAAADPTAAPGSVARPGISDQVFRNIAPNTDAAKYGAIESMRDAAPAFDAAFLQSRIAQMFPAPMTKDDYVGIPGEGGVMNARTGKIVPGTQVAKPQQDAYKDGEIKDFNVGDSIVPMQFNAATKGWKPVGLSAPRWEPQRPPIKDPLEIEKLRDEIARGRASDVQKARSDAATFESADTAFGNVADRAQALIEHPALGSNTGVIGANAPNMSPSSIDFHNQLDTLKSQLVIQAMQQARAGSASGSTGFGGLSEKELSLLQDAVQKLNPASGARNFVKDLSYIRDKMRGLQDTLRKDRYSSGYSIERLK